jgi:hypothetical protein
VNGIVQLAGFPYLDIKTRDGGEGVLANLGLSFIYRDLDVSFQSFLLSAKPPGYASPRLETARNGSHELRLYFEL